jgi:HD-GYP domain-containing protein (c-di-GMP phosphodiesterase class II)
MTRPSGPHEPERRSTIIDATEATETETRQRGRACLKAIYAALRNLKLYPVENEQAQKSLDELERTTKELIEREGELEIRIAGQLLFVNSTRLRLDLHSYASFSYVISTFRQAEVGVMTVVAGVNRKEWQVLISLLLSFAARDTAPNKLSELREKIALGGITHITVDPPASSEADLVDEERQKEVAKRTYERSVAITNELAESARMGRSASVKKVKRAVQGIVDQVLNNEITLIGLTTIRDYDNYTFTHSVNVSIFAVSMGKRLGLNKTQLFDLGMGAFLHDVGKAKLSKEVLNKAGKLTDEEWQLMQLHPTLGATTLFSFRGYGDIPYRSMIAAYEHHMGINLKGYPKSLRPRDLSVYSKIITVADVFDAATSHRVYRGRDPLMPNEILQELLDDHERLGIDVVLVKALINLLGIYPVGTCVILDTYEVAIVHGVNPDPSHIHRPLIRILFTTDGGRVTDAPVTDLAETNPDGSFKKTIIKVTDPEKYGINVRDCFV